MDVNNEYYKVRWLNDLIENTTKIDDALLHGFKGRKDAQFWYGVATSLLTLSRDRRMSAGHAGLLEAGMRRAVNERLEYHRKDLDAVHPDYYVAGIVEAMMHDFGMLRHVVLHRLREHRAELFPAVYFTIYDEPTALAVEHPMPTFVRYLDELEHIKDVDPAQYVANVDRRRAVTALHRVGLAVLPPEGWTAQIVLRNPPGTGPLLGAMATA